MRVGPQRILHPTNDDINKAFSQTMDAVNNAGYATIIGTGNLNLAILNRDTWVYMTQPGTVTVPAPGKMKNKVLVIHNVSSGKVSLNGTIYAAGSGHSDWTLDSSGDLWQMRGDGTYIYMIGGSCIGSNSNGSYIKHSNRRMEQFGATTSAASLSLSSGLYTHASSAGARSFPVAWASGSSYQFTGFDAYVMLSNFAGTVAPIPNDASTWGFREQWPVDYSTSTRTICWSAAGTW